MIWEPKKQQNYFLIVTKSKNILIGFICKRLITWYLRNKNEEFYFLFLFHN